MLNKCLVTLYSYLLFGTSRNLAKNTTVHAILYLYKYKFNYHGYWLLFSQRNDVFMNYVILN